MRTYQNQTSEPTASTPGYATTTWNYEPATGLLLSKLDANSKGASYTYSDDGKLLTRTWARTISGAPLSTSYTYTPAGQLLTTDYSDTTPDVSIRYDRLGRQLTQSNGLATSTFAYDPATLALDTETITYDLNADGTADFTRVLDRSSDDLGRDKGFQLKNGNTVENEAKYGYHATTARLTEISNPQISNLKFTYDYVGNSSLIDAITGPVHSVDLIWEPTRNVLEKRENQVAGNMISGYQYRVNELGQRTGVTQTGSVFAAGQAIAWGYDALGQVTSADHTTQNTQDRAYRYDTIGNRVEAREEITAVTGTPNYTANALNQYTAVGNRAPAHDDDGNLRLDGGVNKDNQPREYVWDAENRLISVKRVSDGAPIVSYLYDSQSRRIVRTQGSATTLYLYDAWNCIAEYSIQNSTFTLQHSRLWGLDLSGTLQGAGGVGGMLAERHHSSTDATFYPTYDGNGNISEYLAQTGTPAARFEYDPFGNTVVNTDATNQFAYRFSTKPADAATGLYYYGYRYYDPVTGRWPSRDAIGESGGNNLYAMVFNDPVNLVDRYGLNVYAVDGTNFNVQRHPEQRSNVADFHNRSLRGGEESKYYGGVASRSSRIGPGDVTGYWGPGAEKLIKQVKADVCADYCAHQSIKINMVGWSRGAVVVQEVAKRLEVDGCCCSDKTLHKPVSVNFLGLYDSVERIPFRDYEDDRPGNIDHFHHAIRSDPGGIFKQQLTGDPNERPYTNNDGSQSSHGDIGTGGNHLDGTQGNTSRAHAAMVRWARNSGVKIDTSEL